MKMQYSLHALGNAWVPAMGSAAGIGEPGAARPLQGVQVSYQVAAAPEGLQQLHQAQRVRHLCMGPRIAAAAPACMYAIQFSFLHGAFVIQSLCDQRHDIAVERLWVGHHRHELGSICHKTTRSGKWCVSHMPSRVPV